jgi:cytochrome c553
MRRGIPGWLLSAGLALVIGPAYAMPGDAARGEQLHRKYCLGCHDTRVYTRADRQMRSIADLAGQINACGHAVPRRFSADEVNDLVKFLNEGFYKFR